MGLAATLPGPQSPLIHFKPDVHRLATVKASLLLVAALSANDLREAAEALGRNDFAGAVPYLRAALADDPENVNARFNLAYALQSTGDEDGAIEQYSLIASRQPDLLEARQNLATLLMQAGRFGEAADEYGAIAAANPDDPAPRMLAAMATERTGPPKAVVEAYRRVLELDPSSLDARLGLARSLEASGMLLEAVEEYLRIADSTPHADQALLNLAERLDESGQRDTALDIFRRHASMNPDDPAVQEDLGLLLLEEGATGEAIGFLERSVKADPMGRRHSALAEAYRRSGRPDAAHEQLRLAAEADPGNASGRLLYGSSLLQRQEFEGAAREYLAAVEADRTQPEAWNGLAFAMYRLNNFPAALRALSESAKLVPPSAASVYLRAICQDNLQMYEEARDSYLAFLARQPGMEDEVWKATQRLQTIEKVLRKR